MRHWLSCAAALAAVPCISLADDNAPSDKINWNQGAAPAESAPAPAPASSPVSRTNTGPYFGFSAEGGFEFGGTDLATVTYTDGSSADLRAGEGLLVGVGGHYRPTKRSPWDVSLMAGYKYDRAGGSNGGVSFERVPIELIGSYQWSNGIRLGAGPVYHTDVSLNGGGFISDIKYKSSIGGELQAGWKWVALTYTVIHYSPEQDYITDNYGNVYPTLGVSGNSFGVRFIGNF